MGSLPPVAFTVRPYADRPDYFAVCLMPTRAEMLDAMRASGLETTDDTAACCVSSSCTRLPALRGLLFFSQEHMGGGVVAHEMAHAAFRTLDAAGTRVQHADGGPDGAYTTHPTEELYCLTLERLVKEFWRGYYDRNLGAPHA